MLLISMTKAINKKKKLCTVLELIVCTPGAYNTFKMIIRNKQCSELKFR